MARIIGIDYGMKRTGLAWTDPLQLIATGIGGIDTHILKDRLKELVEQEDIEAIVIGLPTRMDGTDTHVTESVRTLAKWVEKNFSHIGIHLVDERFTSKMAQEAMLKGGVKKKKRRDKYLLDEMSAVLILQDFLENKN